MRIQSTPISEGTIEDVGSVLGGIASSPLGTTWNVRCHPSDGRHDSLPLHTMSPPYQPDSDSLGLKLLHCMSNQCVGGDSIISDGFRAAWQLKTFEPNMARELITGPKIYFIQGSLGNSGVTRGCHIIRAFPSTGEIKRIYWSPMVQLPIQPYVPNNEAAEYERFRRALKGLSANLEDERDVYNMKLEAGDCLIMRCDRVLYGRQSFDPSTGDRCMRAAYVNIHDYAASMARLGTAPRSKATDPGPRIDREFESLFEIPGFQDEVLARYPQQRSTKDIRREIERRCGYQIARTSEMYTGTPYFDIQKIHSG